MINPPTTPSGAGYANSAVYSKNRIPAIPTNPVPRIVDMYSWALLKGRTWNKNNQFYLEIIHSLNDLKVFKFPIQTNLKRHGRNVFINWKKNCDRQTELCHVRCYVLWGMFKVSRQFFRGFFIVLTWRQSSPSQIKQMVDAIQRKVSVDLKCFLNRSIVKATNGATAQ